jgi:hypothetical protein
MCVLLLDYWWRSGEATEPSIVLQYNGSYRTINSFAIF